MVWGIGKRRFPAQVEVVQLQPLQIGPFYHGLQQAGWGGRGTVYEKTLSIVQQPGHFGWRLGFLFPFLHGGSLTQASSQGNDSRQVNCCFVKTSIARWPLVAFGYLTLSLAALGQPIRPSEESLRAAARFLQALRQERFVLLDTDERRNRLEHIGQKLAAQARRPIPWRFELVDSAEPNAACCGEGMVFATTGLLDLGLSDDELAGVLSHEIIHGVRQHVEADYVQARLLEKAIADYQNHRQRHGQDQSETALMRERYELNRLRQQLNQARSYERHRPAFSRAQESEADRLGLELASRCGYKPEGLEQALQKLLDQQYLRYGQRAILASKTHPPLLQRIERLRELRQHARQ